jgi:glycine dehydrogenase
MATLEQDLAPQDTFARRHLGVGPAEIERMLQVIGVPSLAALIDETVPKGIRLNAALELPPPLGESEALQALRAIAGENQPFRSFIGQGYCDAITPPPILRNILENPGWYTQYTPYQAEISQGRLEALLTFQTMVADLTALPLANASLLDEATAAAEAMHMLHQVAGGKRRGFFVSDDCHPQTIAVVRTRALPLGYEVHVGALETVDFDGQDLFGVLIQYPTTAGRLSDPRDLIARAHAAGAFVVMATDLLALTLLTPPGELGADVAVGSNQRFGLPLGFGGPHAGFFATRDELKRQMPGRLIGVSRDAEGRPAYRLALQTREQHIRREKATSNICTSQVLLAILSAMYAVYHGPEGLRAIARRVHALTALLATGLRRLGYDCGSAPFFDTLRVRLASGAAARIHEAARTRRMNLRRYDDGSIGITLDEAKGLSDVRDLLAVFAPDGQASDTGALLAATDATVPAPFARRSTFLKHEVFNRYHTEHELLRYIKRLESRDLSLTTSMIPLGSCTMKLNAAAEMLPITWTELGAPHPFAPAEQTLGYARLIKDLEGYLAEITGFAAVSLQPNAGSQGEYTGLLAIRAFHQDRSAAQRDVCLIPVSAHGTNPASATLAGFRVVAVACDAQGNIDPGDLEAKAAQHAERLGALMVTYPSTHGVFEEAIKDICASVHRHGGQVYMDGANMNAQVGLTRPADIGADVCHINLHKTFAIPHGGGGPGMGPIAVAAHLAPFLPGHPVTGLGGPKSLGTVSAAPHGSASILPISWMYVRMMGAEGLKRASEIAILNANYIAARLEPHFPILYKGARGRVAHELIVDARAFKAQDIEVEDIAKRLMDYGFHAPTISFPVPGTLMIEPTESESLAELDRLCDALITIRAEIRAIEEGRADRSQNVLKRAPHTAQAVASDSWDRPYPREQAAFPAPWTREHKFWPAVARIDNVYGDRNLVCTCPTVEELAAKK